MVFIDDQTHLMFAGDALNFNLGIGAVPVETTLKALRRLQAMQDQYTGIFNGHHDFRPLGMPLDDDCLPTVISMCEDIVAGHYSACTVPSFWGQPMPLSASDKSDFLPKDAPPMNANKPQRPASALPTARVATSWASTPTSSTRSRRAYTVFAFF